MSTNETCISSAVEIIRVLKKISSVGSDRSVLLYLVLFCTECGVLARIEILGLGVHQRFGGDFNCIGHDFWGAETSRNRWKCERLSNDMFQWCYENDDGQTP